jgi:tetratricopeptide (TPR) repeat protein
MALVSASTTAWADARSECADSKSTPPDRSIATCSEVIRTDARAAWAYNNRGLAYFNKKDYDRAIADYNRAIEINPSKRRPTWQAI